MKTTPLALGALRHALFLVTLFFAAAATTRASDIPGTYSNAGTVVSTADGGASGPAVLQAILNLEFDPAVGEKLYGASSHVEFAESEKTFEARIFDDEGKARWTGQWSQGAEFTRDGDRIVLRLRGPKSDDTYALMFESIDKKLLQITAVRLTATAFGPVQKPVGVYVFGRMK